MQWKTRIFEIEIVYKQNFSIRKTAKELNCSVGIVSEAIQLCNNWELIKDCSSRQEALNTIRKTADERVFIPHEKLNTVSLSPDPNSSLLQFDSQTFDLIISDGRYILEHTLYQLNRVLRNNSFVYFFSTFHNHTEHKNLIKKEFRILRYPLVVLKKGEQLVRSNHYYDVTEIIIIGVKGKPRLANNTTNVTQFDVVNPVLKIHEYERPVKLIEELISNTLKSRGNILDPYCHSAEVLLAARNLGHNYHGICRHEKQFDKVLRKVVKRD